MWLGIDNIYMLVITNWSWLVAGRRGYVQYLFAGWRDRMLLKGKILIFYKAYKEDEIEIKVWKKNQMHMYST